MKIETLDDAVQVMEEYRPNTFQTLTNAVIEIAKRQKHVSANDLRESGIDIDGSKNVIGAVFVRLVKAGLLQRGGYIPASHRQGHGRRVCVFHWAGQ